MGLKNLICPKKDVSLLFCMYYRKLNTEAVKDAYLIPRMEESLDSLGEARTFSTLYANYGYWEIEIDDLDKEKRRLHRPIDCIDF